MFSQGTVESRLLASIFYEQGKVIAQSCPYDKDWKNMRTREYVKQQMNEFLLNFPNLNIDSAPSKGLKILVGTGHCYTPMAFIRMHTRNGFMSKSKSLKNSSALAPV